MKKVLTFLDENLEETLMVILLAALSLVMMSQVIARYEFQQGFVWAEEFCRYCFVYTGMLSAGYCVRKGKGLRVDALYGFFPAPLKLLIDYAGKVLMLFLYAYMFYHSFNLIATTTSVSTAIQLPMKYVYASIPRGMGLGAVRCVQDLVKFTKMNLKKEGK